LEAVGDVVTWMRHGLYDVCDARGFCCGVCMYLCWTKCSSLETEWGSLQAVRIFLIDGPFYGLE